MTFIGFCRNCGQAAALDEDHRCQQIRPVILYGPVGDWKVVGAWPYAGVVDATSDQSYVEPDDQVLSPPILTDPDTVAEHDLEGRLKRMYRAIGALEHYREAASKG